jgi:hypothetical protein
MTKRRPIIALTGRCQALTDAADRVASRPALTLSERLQVRLAARLLRRASTLLLTAASEREMGQWEQELGIAGEAP